MARGQKFLRVAQELRIIFNSSFDEFRDVHVKLKIV
jgi:hypothetical protein